MPGTISTFNGFINYSLNTCASVFESCLNRGGTVMAPGVLGSMGGWLVGVGAGKGLLQGVISGTYHITVHVPIARYVDKNIGVGDDQIHKNTALYIQTIGIVAGVAIPIIVTYYYGDVILDTAFSCCSPDGMIRWMFEGKNGSSYTLLGGTIVNIAPVIVQHWISFWRKEDAMNKKRS